MVGRAAGLPSRSVGIWIGVEAGRRAGPRPLTLRRDQAPVGHQEADLRLRAEAGQAHDFRFAFSAGYRGVREAQHVREFGDEFAGVAPP